MDSNDIYKKEQVPPLAKPGPVVSMPEPNKTGFADSDTPAIAPRVMTLDGGRRSRSHRRRGADHGRTSSRISLLVWGVLSLAVVGYLGALVFFSLRKPAGKAVVSVAKPAAAVPAPSTTNEPARDAVAVSRDLAEKIRAWAGAYQDVGEANLMRTSGKLDVAVTRLKKALAADPDLLDAQFSLALIYLQQEKFIESEELLLKVLAIDPGRQSAREMLARVYAGQRLHQASLEAAHWMLDGDPYSMDAHILAAQACMNLDQPVLAADHWKKVTNVQRDNVLAFNALAQAYQKMGRHGEAIETLKRILIIDDQNSASYYNLAVSYAKQSGVDASIDTLTKAAVLFGNNFVGSWMQAPDFDDIRTNAAFVGFQGLLAQTGTTEVAVLESTASTNDVAAPAATP